MAKIRGIKPEFWTDDRMIEVSPLARLMFIGMWNYACDNGHLEDKPRQIKMRILPADDCDVNELMNELVTVGSIRREGGWVTIPNLSLHQKPDKRWYQRCDAPGCSEAAPPKLTTRTEAPLDPDECPPDPQGGHYEATASHVEAARGHSTEGDGDGDGDGDLKVKERVRAKRAQALPADWTPSPETVAAIRSEVPGLDLRAEHAKFTDHFTANGKTMKNWDAAWRNWMRRSSEFTSSRRPTRQQETDDLFAAAARRMGADQPTVIQGEVA